MHIRTEGRGGNVTGIIGDCLREMREEKKLSQGDIEKRTGLLRCYISRVENGHTVPAIELWKSLLAGSNAHSINSFTKVKSLQNCRTYSSASRPMTSLGAALARTLGLGKLRRLLGKTEEADRKLIFYMAQKMANR